MIKSQLIRLVLGVGGLLALIFLMYATGVTDVVVSGELSERISDYGIFAPLVFIVVYAVLTILFIPASPVTVIGGALFGPWWGTVYVVIGATMGATGAFLLARFIGGSILRSSTSRVAKQLQQYETRLVNNAFITVLILRLIPLFPFNGLNFALGLTRIKTMSYVFATLVGILPGTFTYVYFGSALVSFSAWQIGGAVIGFVALTLAGRYGLQHFSPQHDT